MVRLALLRLSCPACHSKDLHRNRSARIARLLGLKTFRCRNCNTQVLSYIENATDASMTVAPSPMLQNTASDMTPSIAIPPFGGFSADKSAIKGVGHFSHFDKFTWNPMEKAEGVSIKSLRMSDQCRLHLIRIDAGASASISSGNCIKMIYLTEGRAVRGQHRFDAGWCGILQADAEPVELTAESECQLLVASYNRGSPAASEQCAMV